MNYVRLILLLMKIAIIYSNIIRTNDLSSALKQALPGDTIELESCEYSSVPYKLIGGKENNPITIKSSFGATVKFRGSYNNCIFELNEISYLSIEGPFELLNSLCGITAIDVSNIKINGLKIHNMQQYGIIISGENNEISNNEIYDCVMDNQITSKILTSGWKQCVSVVGKNSNNYYSKNIVFKNNNIRDSFGEGLYFYKCDDCSSLSNNITNTYSNNLFIHSSKNIVIDSNLMRVTTGQFDTQIGNACGIGLTSGDNKEDMLDNIIIKNNIIIGTRIAINFIQSGNSRYNNVKILHNTIWQITVTSLWFEKPSNTPVNCELRNNIIYMESWIADFSPKKSWSMGKNFYYNIQKIPIEFSDTDMEETSTAMNFMDLNMLFNNRQFHCNYYDKGEDVDCFRPSTVPNFSFTLFHGGSASSVQVEKDFAGCIRSTTTPSIGAYEYYFQCTENYEVEDLRVKFKINYCLAEGETIRMIGTFNNWNPNDAPIFIDEGNDFFSYTFDSIEESFEYKFVIVCNNLVIRSECEPNRYFNANELAKAIKYSWTGNYENCNYYKEMNTMYYMNTVTLQCNWK